MSIFRRRVEPERPERPCLQTMLLPNGRFLMVLSGANTGPEAADSFGALSEPAGAAATVVFPEPLIVLDADPPRLGLMRSSEQPAPRQGTGGSIFELVHSDLTVREQIGAQRYGGTLQAFNGRDALWDAYEEAMDLAVYLRQAIAERDATSSTPAEPAKEPTPLESMFDGRPE